MRASTLPHLVQHLGGVVGVLDLGVFGAVFEEVGDVLGERERSVVLPAHEAECADEAFADVDELAAAQAAPLPPRVGALGVRVGGVVELRALGPLVQADAFAGCP